MVQVGGGVFKSVCHVVELSSCCSSSSRAFSQRYSTRSSRYFFFLPRIVCLLLALQWGGATHNWSNARIIVLLVPSGVIFVAFIFVQRWKGENATILGHIFLNRSIIADAWFSFCNGGSMQTMFYFLPIWFQAIKDASAVESGIMNLPMVLGLVIVSVSAGIITRRIGYFTPWMILSSIITPIGAGLISTFTPLYCSSCLDRLPSTFRFWLWLWKPTAFGCSTDDICSKGCSNWCIVDDVLSDFGRCSVH
jgi:hypothetical protein